MGWIVIVTAAWMLLLSVLHLVFAGLFRHFRNGAAANLASPHIEQATQKKTAILLPTRNQTAAGWSCGSYQLAQPNQPNQSRLL